jgi:hypothetical protein
MLFDASNRDQCEAKRTSTNTPLQALNMLNDPTVLEAARVLAQKLSAENISIDQKIEKAFTILLIRKPKFTEKYKLLSYFLQQQNYLKSNTQMIDKIINVGEYKNNQKDKNAIEVAALMKTCMILYNLEETITKS